MPQTAASDDDDGIARELSYLVSGASLSTVPEWPYIS
jgi:hypothetical protein